MQPIASTPFEFSRPVLTVSEMTAADQGAVARGVPSLTLMEYAGFAVASVIARQYDRRPVTVLCGPGNNGGDGYVVARILARRGWTVRVLELAPPATPDARCMAARWRGERAPLVGARLCPDDLIVDALFGAGLTRDIDRPLAEILNGLNAAGATCVSVDMPSGVDGDTGQVRGTALQCAHSVTFFQPKPGHLLFPGRALCGRIHVADIGIPGSVLDGIRPTLCVNAPGLWRVPVPDATGHKYDRGHTVVVSGPLLTGAARLAARAARRAGAGLVTLAGETSALPMLSFDQPGVMIKSIDDHDPIGPLLADPRHNAFVLGPGRGVSEQTAGEALQLAASGRSIVLDADALTSLAGKAADLRDAVKGACVITPHEGEFARLFAAHPDCLPPVDRLTGARQAARIAGAVLVRKGADTIIAAPDGRAAINADAPPWLATAGSGDVLSGIIAGLLSQGMPSFEAACAGVWLHGAAANRVGPGLIAEDLPEALGHVIGALGLT